MSAATIAAVYAVGYVNTDATDVVSDPVVPQVAATSVPAARPTEPPSRTSAGDRSQQPSPASRNPSPSATAAADTALKDGTFTGTGHSRHGDIQATVVVSGGKIVSAAVSICSTRYPCSYVTPLVSEVVARQAAPVNHISGATDSSQAYTQAIIQALGRARA